MQSLALAQDGITTRSPVVAESERLFQQGVELAAEEEFVRSAEAFSRSLELFRSQTTAFNLAQVLYRAGQGVRALAISRALADGEYGEVSAEGQQALVELRSAIEPTLAHLDVRTDPLRANATLLVDGSEAGSTDEGGDVSTVLDAGDHLIELRNADEAARTVVDVGPGERRQVTLTLEPATTALGRRRRRLAIALPIVAAVVAATAITLAVGLSREPNHVLDPVVGDIQLLRVSP